MGVPQKAPSIHETLAGAENPKGRAFTYYARLQRVKEYVESDPARDLSLSAAARVAGMQSKCFSAFFREKTGLRYTDWVSQQRVHKAMDLIRNRNVVICRVAYEVGFRDLRTFQRAFKRWASLTPRQYKRLVRPC